MLEIERVMQNSSALVSAEDVVLNSERSAERINEGFANKTLAHSTFGNIESLESSENIEKSQKCIKEALIQSTDQIDHQVCGAGDEDSFFVADLGQVARAYQVWQKRLPNVHAHYAIKCNTDEKVVRLLGMMGANFDCASANEIDTVLGLGFDASRIIYANPCKTNSFLRRARDQGVNLTTVDNIHEISKLHEFHPGCKVLIRIVTNDESANCRLSAKFGCTMDSAINELLPGCIELGVEAVGVSFHVGSGATDFSSIENAIENARIIFNRAESLGHPMSILDIGGGFEWNTFAESSDMVASSLDKYFPAEYTQKNGIHVIAEPGRLLVANAFTLATHVIARRDLDKNQEDINAMLYINDGVYGNLNCILFDHQHPIAKVLKTKDTTFPCFQHLPHPQKFIYSIWGPTCDGLDCVMSKSVLPADVHPGDWLYFPNVGAYTTAATTSFNGFSGKAKVIYITSE